MSFRGGLPGARSCEGTFAWPAAPSAGWVGWSEKKCVLPSSAFLPPSIAIEIYLAKKVLDLESLLHFVCSCLRSINAPFSAPSRFFLL